MKNKKILWMVLTGLIIGAIAVILVVNGNPANMGFCIACFVRDMAGSMGMHQAAVVQYMRPEIIGLVIGAFLMSVARKEFRAQGGSSPFTRFILGFFVIVGALMFLGCPLRMVLRIAGGDLNAIVGLVGFVGGIMLGILALAKGFSLKRTHDLGKLEGMMFPAVNLVFFAMMAVPGLLLVSEKGPGASHAPVWMALIAGLVVGALAQKTRLCMVGGIRDAALFKDYYLLTGFIAIIAAAMIGNAITGNLHFGFAEQAVAHSDAIWNILGMVLVGFASVLLGGCPLRQLILAGSGNSDSAVTVVGLFVGAAFCHNFKLAASAEGPTPAGKIAVLIGIAVVTLIAVANIQKKKSNN